MEVQSPDLGNRQKDLAEDRMKQSPEVASEEAVAQRDQPTGYHYNDHKRYKIYQPMERHSGYRRKVSAESLQMAVDQQRRSTDPASQCQT